MSYPLVVGITGASGAVYAVRLLQVLLRSGYDVHLTISRSGRTVIAEELGVQVCLERFEATQLGLDCRNAPTGSSDLLQQIVQLGQHEIRRAAAPNSAGDDSPSPSPGKLTYHHFNDYMTPIASGSFLTRGMVICPCSGGTLSAVVNGVGANLIQRAADVHIKERRKLILVPRETPLSVIHLDNMKRVCEAGAVVLPAMPGWYHGVESLIDMVDFIVARILDQLEIDQRRMKRWASDEPTAKEGGHA
jgi:4-hydroxy-3-polyprenylbenzoate decarboxylase